METTSHFVYYGSSGASNAKKMLKTVETSSALVDTNTDIKERLPKRQKVMPPTEGCDPKLKLMFLPHEDRVAKVATVPKPEQHTYRPSWLTNVRDVLDLDIRLRVLQNLEKGVHQPLAGTHMKTKQVASTKIGWMEGHNTLQGLPPQVSIDPKLSRVTAKLYIPK